MIPLAGCGRSGLPEHMPAAPEITDRESLFAWLNALPRDTPEQEAEAQRIAVAIAHRAAMRLLPLALRSFLSREARGEGLKPQYVFRQLLISGVAGILPTPATKQAAHAAALRPAGGATANSAAYSAATAAFSPAEAAAHCAAYAAADAAAYNTAGWSTVSGDCRALSIGEALHRRSLWPDAVNPISKQWQSAAKALVETGPEWIFWIDWYEKCLAGAPQDWEGLLTDIALIPSEDWEKGPKHIARLIEAMQRARDAARADADTKTVEAVRLAVSVNREPLRYQLQALVENLTQELERLKGDNGLDPEIRDLLTDLRRIATELLERLPNVGPVDQETAGEMTGLLALYSERFKQWPRLHVDDVVDGTCRITLIGLSAGVFGLAGLPAWAGAALGGAVFGGKRIVETAKSIRGSITGGGG